jgi:MarR family transcriptional regulator for hemolysin
MQLIAWSSCYIYSLFMEVKLIEPISRKLNILGRAYLTELGNHMAHLGINQYYYPLTVICFYDGKLTQKALSEKLGKDKSIIVKMIDTLTEKGFVYRQVNPEDRRQHLLGVTDKAKKTVPHIIKAFEHMNQSASKNISAQDMDIFLNVLNKMNDNLVDFTNKEYLDNTK